jgi:thiamine pyrophosphate-dependent acetolactate synthase large subunit-like protein
MASSRRRTFRDIWYTERPRDPGLGENLIRRSERLEVKLALEIATQVAAGLVILADEALTSGYPYYHYITTCVPMTTSTRRAVQSGGMIPVGIGAAVARPDPQGCFLEGDDSALEGDDSAMYTLQALWRQARERLDVTTVIYANRFSENAEYAEREFLVKSSRALARGMLLCNSL